MEHQTKLTLTSTTPEHIGLKNRPRDVGLIAYARVLLPRKRILQELFILTYLFVLGSHT